jgi:hypothetical protein
MLPSLGVQSQGTPLDMEESPNPKHLVGATSHRQEDKPEMEPILLVLRSSTLG